MKRIFSLLQVLSVALLSATLVACTITSPSVSFYTVTSLDEGGTIRSSAKRAYPLAIRVMPVGIPDYLDRPEIMTRKGRNTLELAEFNRWAGSFKESITAVLAENLGLLLGSDLVYVHPPLDIREVDYRVAMTVIRLDSRLGGQVLLKAKWMISPVRNKAPVVTQVSTFIVRLTDDDYETLAAGISQALEQASRKIAEKIISLSSGPAEPPDLQLDKMPQKQ